MVNITPDERKRLGELIGGVFGYLFSESRSFARMKMLGLWTVMTVIGIGFVARVVVGPTNVDAWIDLSSPSTGQIIGAVVAFGFVLAANVYARRMRSEQETEFLRIAANPHTPQDVRDAALQRLTERYR